MNKILEWIKTHPTDNFTVHPDGRIEKGCGLTNPELICATPLEGYSIFLERHRFFNKMPFNKATSEFLKTLGPVLFRRIQPKSQQHAQSHSVSLSSAAMSSAAIKIPKRTKRTTSDSKLFQEEDRKEDELRQTYPRCFCGEAWSVVSQRICHICN